VDAGPSHEPLGHWNRSVQGNSHAETM